MPRPKTIAVDFDGVIHKYTSGWQGALTIPDPPVRGAFEFLAKAVQCFEVVIYSTRLQAEGAEEAVIQWMKDNHIDWDVLAQLTFSAKKPPAVLYIDDRGYPFSGVFPSLDYIDNFKPWNKQDRLERIRARLQGPEARALASQRLEQDGEDLAWLLDEVAMLKAQVAAILNNETYMEDNHGRPSLYTAPKDEP